MNELQQVERLRAEVPDDLDLTAARARFRDGMEKRPPRRLVRPLLMSAATAAAAAGALAVALLVAPDSGPKTAPVANVSLLLNRAADAALKDPLPTPRPDQYIYIELQETQPADATGSEGWLGRQHTQLWQSVNGARPNYARHLQLSPLPIPGRPLPPAAKRQPSIAPEELLAEPCGIRPPLDRPYLDALPADPGALLRLMDGAGGDGDRGDRLWESASNLLVSSAAPPPVQAALYRAIARIPGVRLVDRSEDAAGREGIAVARVNGAIRTELIFDRTSYAFLGERGVVVSTGDDGPAGALVSSSAVLRVSVADAPPKPGPNAAHGDC
ncbi:CU044_5270 family protein [Actinomadura rubrisoli]|uniref:CU044_5270 family protein n=1 Tax=Actinomadura rubrisoli TaxID=2530368 RepID=A0A4R5BTE1_9ACTN|nr:CU044_5270 family protein [Actinomadura rubrisoli]TDD87394.1 hypothetical protein E1298_16195 [Actinomadura rubrisoli]